MENKLLKIINYYGVENQLRKFSEENFELIEAIHGWYFDMEGARYQGNENNIKEEIADNLVLLSQFILYYDIDLSDIEKIFKQKVNRQIERIEKGE